MNHLLESGWLLIPIWDPNQCVPWPRLHCEGSDGLGNVRYYCWEYYWHPFGGHHAERLISITQIWNSHCQDQPANHISSSLSKECWWCCLPGWWSNKGLSSSSIPPSSFVPIIILYAGQINREINNQIFPIPNMSRSISRPRIFMVIASHQWTTTASSSSSAIQRNDIYEITLSISTTTLGSTVVISSSCDHMFIVRIFLNINLSPSVPFFIHLIGGGREWFDSLCPSLRAMQINLPGFHD